MAYRKIKQGFKTKLWQLLRMMYPPALRWIIALIIIITLATTTFIVGLHGLWQTTPIPPSQIVVSILSDPKTFNYALSQESPNIFGFTYEGLTSENGVTGELEPALAESWEIANDSKTITFTLRPGLRWSDGQPLTADDVVFTYNSIYLNERIPTDTRDILRIGTSRALPKVREIDDRRIQFLVPEPFAPFLRTVGSLPIQPAHVLRPLVETNDVNGKPRFLSAWDTSTNPKDIVFNGSYVLEQYIPAQRVIFRRNPYYWRRNLQGQPQPYVEKIIWQIVESSDTSLLQFRSGGLDAVNVTPDVFSLLKQQEKRGNFTIYNGGPASGVTFISFNLNQGKRNGKPLVDPIKSRWFNNLNFRQAVAYAIDRQTLINNVFRGLGETQNTPISVQSPYNLTPSEGLKVYDYNQEKAKQLLQQGGFRYTDQGRLEDDQGNPVRFSLITNAGNKMRESMGVQIKRDLDQIGIQVDFNPISFGILVDKLSNGLDWEWHLLGFTGGVEPNNGANIWAPDGGLHSFNQKPQTGQVPITDRVVADWEQRIGDLYIQAARELDETKRKALYAQTQQITQANLPFIYLVNPLAMSAIRNRVQGVRFSALGGGFWNIYELRLQD